MHISVACVLLDYVSGLDSLQMLVDLTVYNSAKGTHSRLQYVPGHIAPISSHDFGRKQKAWYRKTFNHDEELILSFLNLRNSEKSVS